MTYKAPLKDMLFNIRHIADIEQVAKIPGFADAGFETAQAVLEECAKANTLALMKALPMDFNVFCTGKLVASHRPCHPWA